ncbi:hypothetical protein Vafri_16068 [Volvox africanus]|uniref:Uncharacterized protein n=1 Tax=Volvox africanus TaxID=51714 RepID=A0A8J4BHD5_9CHLO|nr:hypothetical protein Vafri_16068 [Volvox africanus]
MHCQQNKLPSRRHARAPPKPLLPPFKFFLRASSAARRGKFPSVMTRTTLAPNPNGGDGGDGGGRPGGRGDGDVPRGDGGDGGRGGGSCMARRGGDGGTDIKTDR